jgi:predicted transcriptional regulator
VTEQPGDGSRRAILAALRERQGGSHKKELCRLTGRGWGTVGHHVYNLAKAGVVATEVHGRQLWVFLPELSQVERHWLVATRTPQRKRVLDYILTGQPKTINLLSDEMAMSRKVIRTHLQHLQRYGVVKSTDDYPPKYLHVHKER